MPVESVLLTVWKDGPEKPELDEGRVDVWRLRLDELELGAAPLALTSATSKTQGSVLSPDELARASRFHFEKDRIRFTRCRTALRMLLARYLGAMPQGIRFIYTSSGKPELAADQNPGGLRFNVSHSDNLALIAVGGDAALGVDIEKMRADVNTAELSERFFSAREREGLRALPETLRVAAFYACWARKEAFLKATGEGLGFPLSDFSVTVHPEKEPRIEEIKGDANAARRWSLVDLPAEEDFRAALAVEREATAVATFILRT